MRPAAIALLFVATALLAVPHAAAAGATLRGHGFDTALKAQVFGAALAFAAPRILDPATPAELTLWGLGGITALDPALSADRHGTEVRLATTDRILLARPMPAPDDATGWGRLAADMNAAAIDASPTLRHAGAEAVTQSFFDEMFNHLDPYSRYVAPVQAEEERGKLSLDASAGLAWCATTAPSPCPTWCPAAPARMPAFASATASCRWMARPCAPWARPGCKPCSPARRAPTSK